MDILNFISWIRGGRIVKTVNPTQSVIPVATRDTTRDDGWLTNAMTVEDFAAQIASAPAYKVYTALLTQTGTDTPVATVLENTLGGEPVWVRNDVGEYTATLNNAFNNFFVSSLNIDYNLTLNESVCWAGLIDTSNIYLVVVARGDGSLTDNWGIYIEIKVYN
jgi:hypothetical protein